MSHFPVTVCLPPMAREDVDAAIKKALAPFDEHLEVEPYKDFESGAAAEHVSVAASRAGGLLPSDGDLTWQQVADAYNTRHEYGPDDSGRMQVDADGRAYTWSIYSPNSMWDWWVIGGRWLGYFVVKPEHDGDARLIKGEPGTFDNKAEPGRVDGGPRGLLDFEALRNAQATEAGELYDRWTKLVDGMAEAQPWSYFLAQRDADPQRYSIDLARTHYGAQDRVRAARTSEFFRWANDPIAEFEVGRETYTRMAAEGAVPGYALLDLEGTWQAPGRMGWFGMSSDDEGDRAAYNARANTYLDELPDDAWVVVVDCHI